jgi:Tfp pilus assembly protein PilF
VDNVERFEAFTELVNTSVENVMSTMQRVHQGSVDLSVELFQQLGFWQESAERYRQAHAVAMENVYGRIVSVNNDFGAMLVNQAHNLDRFLRSVGPEKQD